MSDFYERLRAPFPIEDIRFADIGDGKQLRFVEAIKIQERLDEVCGPGGWEVNITLIPHTGVVCELVLWVNGEPHRKSSTSGLESGIKQAETQAFKRVACYAWGIARSQLYDRDDAPPAEAPKSGQPQDSKREGANESEKRTPWKPTGAAKHRPQHTKYRPPKPGTKAVYAWLMAANKKYDSKVGVWECVNHVDKLGFGKRTDEWSEEGIEAARVFLFEKLHDHPLYDGEYDLDRNSPNTDHPENETFRERFPRTDDPHRGSRTLILEQVEAQLRGNGVPVGNKSVNAALRKIAHNANIELPEGFEIHTSDDGQTLYQLAVYFAGD